MAALLLGAAACNERAPSESIATTTQNAEGDTCTPTGAHGAHEFSIGCTLCHACGGTFGFADLVLPRGTSTAGATMDLGPPVNCTVQCHNLNGTSTDPVYWDTVGPLACSSCHDQGTNLGGTPIVTSHPVDASSVANNREACQGCHDQSDHLGGYVHVSAGDGTILDVTLGDPVTVNVVCSSCHVGAGRTLLGVLPPIVRSFDDVGGDFHGSRAGTGWGGTLLPPYARGQGPLPCTTCHDAHASGNAFLFRSTVNGNAITTAISQYGQGAEALCESCHAGDRHAGCQITACHGTDPVPAGDPCFFCHRHNGIVNFTYPSWTNHPNWSAQNCSHCHDAWYSGTPDTTPPVITNLRVLDVTSSSAVISWYTAERSTTHVQYGLGALTTAVGDNAMVRDHLRTLTGLAAGSVYSYRVTSTDIAGNTAATATATFTTPSAGQPPAPVLVLEGYQNAVPCPPTCTPTLPVTLNWNPVVVPTGNPAQYRVIVDTSSSFASPDFDSGWISATSYSASFPLPEWPGVRYYWRVMARDAVTLTTSPWSTTDSFEVYQYDPYY